MIKKVFSRSVQSQFRKKCYELRITEKPATRNKETAITELGNPAFLNCN